LFNADRLTSDAQFALRRCIELYNHNTRYFIVTCDKYKLMKPILSRFCELYVPPPQRPPKVLSQPIRSLLDTLTPTNVEKVAFTLYENAGCVEDVELYLLETSTDLLSVYTLLMHSSKLKTECYNEHLSLIIFLYMVVFNESLSFFL
jgi:hypothetical protein